MLLNKEGDLWQNHLSPGLKMPGMYFQTETPRQVAFIKAACRMVIIVPTDSGSRVVMNGR